MKEVKMISLESIIPDKNQPRKEFEAGKLKILMNSISKKGILNPLVVEKNGKEYILIDGERRYRSAVELGLKEVPCIVEDPMSSVDRLVMRFHLQEMHSNWSAFDKARAIIKFQEEEELDVDELSNMIGIRVKTLKEYISLAKLSKATSKLYDTGSIKYSQIRYLILILNRARSIEERNKLETKLIQMIKDELIDTRWGLAKLLTAVKNNIKTIDIILDPKEQTLNEIIEKSGAIDSIVLRNIKSGASYLKINIDKALEGKFYKSDEWDIVRVYITKLKKSLDKAIDV